MIIKTDGQFYLKANVNGHAASSFVVYISGVYSTATVKLVYKDGFGNFIDLEDGNLASNTQNIVNAGKDAAIFLDVSGADGSTNIAVDVRGVL